MSKRILVINDVAGFGRCSTTCCLPVLSVMNYETVVIPTALLSSSTAYDDFVFEDYSDKMALYMEHYDSLGLTFDAILCGFLGSEKALTHLLAYFEKHPDAYLMVDPIMGDNGLLYATYNERLVEAMRELVSKAQIITPNVTELCALCKVPYHKMTFDEMEALCASLHIPAIIVSGIEMDRKICNLIYEEGKPTLIYERELKFPSRNGSGDLFSSIVLGALMRGSSLFDSVKLAADFIYEAIEVTAKQKIDEREGLNFEGLLYTLGEPYEKRINVY